MAKVSQSVNVPAAGQEAQSGALKATAGTANFSVKCPALPELRKPAHFCVQVSRDGAWYGLQGAPDLRATAASGVDASFSVELPAGSDAVRLAVFTPVDAGDPAKAVATITLG